jgi:hypothetical protein
VLLYANGTFFGAFIVQNASGYTSTGGLIVPASEIPYGTLQVVAEFAGGPNMDPSISSAVPLTVTASDFSMSAVGGHLTITSGQSATVPVLLGGPGAANITVGLSCATSSADISCSVSPGSASFTGSGAASLTINAFGSASAAVVPMGPGENGRTPGSRVAVAAAFLFLLLLPKGRRGRLPVLAMALVAALSLAVGCGGSGSGSGSSGAPSTPAVAGSYSVVVSGVSAGITHNATVNFSVQ